MVSAPASASTATTAAGAPTSAPPTDDTAPPSAKTQFGLRYLNQFVGQLRCAPTLMEMKLFPDAKELTEAMGAWQAVRDHVFPDTATLHTYGSDEAAAGATSGHATADPSDVCAARGDAAAADAATALAASSLLDRRSRERDAFILVGDGSTPRTAALFAHMAPSWRCVSVDPQLKYDTVASRAYRGRESADMRAAVDKWDTRVPNLVMLRRKIEQVRVHCRRAVIVMVHAHVGLDAAVEAVRASAGIVGVVCVPCCNNFASQAVFDGRGPDVCYVDTNMISQQREVRCWSTYAHAMLPATTATSGSGSGTGSGGGSGPVAIRDATWASGVSADVAAAGEGGCVKITPPLPWRVPAGGTAPLAIRKAAPERAQCGDGAAAVGAGADTTTAASRFDYAVSGMRFLSQCLKGGAYYSVANGEPPNECGSGSDSGTRSVDALDETGKASVVVWRKVRHLVAATMTTASAAAAESERRPTLHAYAPTGEGARLFAAMVSGCGVSARQGEAAAPWTFVATALAPQTSSGADVVGPWDDATTTAAFPKGTSLGGAVGTATSDGFPSIVDGSLDVLVDLWHVSTVCVLARSSQRDACGTAIVREAERVLRPGGVFLILSASQYVARQPAFKTGWSVTTHKAAVPSVREKGGKQRHRRKVKPGVGAPTMTHVYVLVCTKLADGGHTMPAAPPSEQEVARRRMRDAHLERAEAIWDAFYARAAGDGSPGSVTAAAAAVPAPRVEAAPGEFGAAPDIPPWRDASEPYTIAVNSLAMLDAVYDGSIGPARVNVAVRVLLRAKVALVRRTRTVTFVRVVDESVDDREATRIASFDDKGARSGHDDGYGAGAGAAAASGAAGGTVAKPVQVTFNHLVASPVDRTLADGASASTGDGAGSDAPDGTSTPSLEAWQGAADELVRSLRCGDVVGVVAYMGVSRFGMRTLFAQDVFLLHDAQWAATQILDV